MVVGIIASLSTTDMKNSEKEWRKIAHLVDQRRIVGSADCQAEADKRHSHLKGPYICSSKE